MDKGVKIGILIGSVAVVGTAIFLLTRNKSSDLVSQTTEDSSSETDDSSEEIIKKCPYGFREYGDGSACVSNSNNSHRCALWGNANLGRCYCPDGMTEYGDGSACEGNGNKCAKYGNASLERC